MCQCKPIAKPLASSNDLFFQQAVRLAEGFAVQPLPITLKFCPNGILRRIYGRRIMTIRHSSNGRSGVSIALNPEEIGEIDTRFTLVSSCRRPAMFGHRLVVVGTSAAYSDASQEIFHDERHRISRLRYVS